MLYYKKSFSLYFSWIIIGNLFRDLFESRDTVVIFNTIFDTYFIRRIIKFANLKKF